MKRKLNTKCLLKHFSRIRRINPALRFILIPEKLWPEYKKYCSTNFDETFHQSILLLAFKRGNLFKIIDPINRYLIQNDVPKKELSKQYIKDLQEKWMYNENALERHQQARRFLGKVIELMMAYWLEQQNWVVIKLAALGENADIIAEDPKGLIHAIEVKYIGQKDDVFCSVLASLSGGDGGGSESLYDAADYLVFRVYEAAKQLEKLKRIRTVLLVISNTWWGFVSTQIREGWINWESPSFFNHTNDWKSFVKEQKRKYPQIDNDLKSTIENLSHILIVKENDNFDFSIILQKQI
jgi:hypothetical protein